MSAQQARIATILMTIIGVVLVGVVLALVLTAWWCTHVEKGEETAIFDQVCGHGSLKEIAIALIGAVSALFGAYQLKGR
jgi:heme/copper-type cytochrome/quinol oxidase subunit 2